VVDPKEGARHEAQEDENPPAVPASRVVEGAGGAPVSQLHTQAEKEGSQEEGHPQGHQEALDRLAEGLPLLEEGEEEEGGEGEEEEVGP
jgi:hypothetical protein